MAAETEGKTLAGFVVFASALLILSGLINITQGLTGLLADERLGMTRDNLVIVNVTAWGWTTLALGLLLIAVGGGLLSAAAWSRIAAIVVVGLHLVVQTAWLDAYPVWSVLMIALDVVVLYAVTVRWSDVRARLGGVGAAPWTGPAEGDFATNDQRVPPHA